MGEANQMIGAVMIPEKSPSADLSTITYDEDSTEVEASRANFIQGKVSLECWRIEASLNCDMLITASIILRIHNSGLLGEKEAGIRCVVSTQKGF